MTFDKLIRNWQTTNGLKMSVGYERFGKATFWGWLNGKIPLESSIPDISDKTGLPIADIEKSISESKAQRDIKRQKRVSTKGNTLGKMLGEWMEINSISRKQAREIFGFGFDTWIIDKCVPLDKRVKELSDKTGYTEAEIRQGMRNTKESLNGTEPKKEPEHTQAELVEEADAVRKLKAGLEAIVTPETVVERVICPPLEDKPTANVIAGNDEGLDVLLTSYAEAYNEKQELLKKLQILNDRIEDVNNSLITIRNSIRRAV